MNNIMDRNESPSGDATTTNGMFAPKTITADWEMFSPSAAPTVFSINGTFIDGIDNAPLQPPSDTVAAAIAIMIFVVCFLLAGPSACMRSSPVQTRSTTSTARRKKQVSDPQRVKRRYQTISNWLITKDVVEHNANGCWCTGANLQHLSSCQLCADADESSLNETHQCKCSKHIDRDTDDGKRDEECARNMNSTAPLQQEEDSAVENEDQHFSDHQNRKDCHICMEEFEVGDKVSWSASDTCNHAYHFQCIKEWLLKKKGCPYCRQTMLPIDDTFTDMAQLVEAKKRKEELTFFCQKDGLVIIPSTSISSPTIQGTDSAALLLVLLDDEAVAESDKEGDLFDIEPPLGNDIIVMTASWEGGSTDGDEDDLETGLGSGSTSTISTSTSLR